MELLRFLANLRCPPLDVIFGFFSFFGEEIFVLGIICLLFWCVDKRTAYAIAFPFFASGMLVQVLKITFRVGRPWLLDSTFRPVPSALDSASGYSFPSGHTQSSSTLFTSLVLRIRRRWFSALSVVVILGVMMSRMYLGVHTPLDVCTSLVISVTLSVVVSRVMDRLGDDTSHDAVIAALLAAISLGAMVYALILMQSGGADFENTLDCVKAAAAGLGFAVGFYAERRFVKFTVDASVAVRAARFAVGIVGALAIKEGVKLLVGGVVGDVARYVLLPIWVLAVFPALFMKVKNK